MDLDSVSARDFARLSPARTPLVDRLAERAESRLPWAGFDIWAALGSAGSRGGAFAATRRSLSAGVSDAAHLAGVDLGSLGAWGSGDTTKPVAGSSARPGNFYRVARWLLLKHNSLARVS